MRKIFQHNIMYLLFVPKNLKDRKKYEIIIKYNII